MKPDWKKETDKEKAEAEKEIAKARDAVRPNFMSQKQKPESAPAQDKQADVTSGARVNRPDWREQKGKAKPEPTTSAEPVVEEALEPVPAPVIEEPEPVAEKPSVPETYTVQSGDSLSVIAQRIYGDSNFWVDIWKLNQAQIPDPNVIRPGQELKLPPVP